MTQKTKRNDLNYSSEYIRCFRRYLLFTYACWEMGKCEKKTWNWTLFRLELTLIIKICLAVSVKDIFMHSQPQNPQTLQTVGSPTSKKKETKTSIRPTQLLRDPLDLSVDSGNNGLFPVLQNGSFVSAALVCWIRTIPHQPIICGIFITRHTLPYISIITPVCLLMRIFQDEGWQFIQVLVTDPLFFGG